jgi:hypothetical protein
MFWVYVLVIIAFYAFVVGRVVNKSSTSSLINDSNNKQNTTAPANLPQTGNGN